jgi:Tol biopolymer transport system component
VNASPDGGRLAIVTRGLTEQAPWSYDVARGTLNKLTPEGEASFPRWTPDGQRVAFPWLSGGHAQLAGQRADGTMPPEVLASDVGVPSSWSPDGRQLALVKDGDLWVAMVEGSRASVQQITRTPYRETSPAFSPDGRWLAYSSEVSGRSEVYVQPWPGPGPREQVSLEGGANPAWNPGGRELFFLTWADQTGKLRMMVAEVRTSPTLSLGVPRVLFDFSTADLVSACVPANCHSVAPDGQRFFFTRLPPAVSPPPVTHIHLVQNWLEELKARVAAGPTR